MRIASLAVLPLLLAASAAAAAPPSLAGRWYIDRDVDDVVVVTPLEGGRLALASPGHWEGVAMTDSVGFWGVFRYLDAEPDARWRTLAGTHRARLGLDGRLRVEGRFVSAGGPPFWRTWSPAGMPPPEPPRTGAAGDEAYEAEAYEGDRDEAGADEPLPAWGARVKVDEKPMALVEEQPVYPAEALAKRVQGTVTVRALVDRRGLVRDARVVRSVRLLDAAALSAARAWRFRPALREGRPVACWVDVPVRFRIF